MKHVALTVLLGVALAGCSSEEVTTEAFCNNSFGAGATYTFTCDAGCALPGSGSAATDRNLNTTASIVPVDGQASYTAVLTATSATDLPGGTAVGVFVSQPQARQSMTNVIKTYLNGNLQETLAPANTVIVTPDSGTPADGFLGMRTTATEAFDQVEFTATVTWGVGQTPVYYVYEVCSDGGEF